MNTQQPFNEPTNLHEFNQHLLALELPRVNAEQLSIIRDHEPRIRLINALNQARTDKNAKIFLNNVLHKAGVNSDQPTPPKQMDDNAFVQTPSPQHAQVSSGNTPTSTATIQNTRSDQAYIGHHVYGKKGALYFRAEKIDGKDNKADWHTIMIDAALSSAPRQFNWREKICIRLTIEELPQVAAVLFGIVPKANFANHGPSNNKGFTVEHQGKNIFVSLNEQGKPAHAVPVSVADAFYIGNLFLRQMRENQPWLDASDILISLKAIVGRMKTQKRAS